MSNPLSRKTKGRDGGRIVSVFLLSLGLLSLLGCRSKVPPVCYDLPDTVELRSGDLAFRKGESREGRAVTTLDRGGDYTHVGMVVWHNGAWYVLHAVPGERATEQEEDSVKIEPLGTFYRSDRAVKGGLYRYPMADDDTLRLLRRGLSLYSSRHPLFDSRFDAHDTTAFYCTELVCFLYQQVLGVDLSEGRRHDLPLYPNLIFCSDVFRNPQLSEVHAFQVSR